MAAPCLKLEHPWSNPNAKSKRRYWHLHENSGTAEILSSVEPDRLPVLVYEASKLTSNGVIGYKVFENCYRKMHRHSLSNLLTAVNRSDETLDFCINQYKACLTDEDRKTINNQAVSLLSQTQFDLFLQATHQSRHLNAAQSRKIRALADKLCYYTQARKFTSKKSGSYNFRVAFLTLTAPDGADPEAILKAFNKFLDYLQRTANCFYVWKKELGEKSHHLHFHLVINNFIPYYIINWKWKRVLIGEGVSFPADANGKTSQSHYRIELPRSKKEVSHYISKYLSKAYDLPGKYGYISGHSSILSKLKEVTVYTGDGFEDEIISLKKVARVCRKDYVTLLFCDLLSLKDLIPKLHAVFEEQYLRFSELITLPQKFFFV